MFESGKIRTALVWTGKRKRLEKLPSLPFQTAEIVNEPRKKTLDLYAPVGQTWQNLLIWGDNKLVMNSLLKDFEGNVNLIYIDPPFATGADFRMPIRIDGERFVKEPSGIEIKAYRDTWGEGLASYLQMMYDRLIFMRKLLDPENGSIYVHMDWHLGHYVKVITDEIFGKENFRSEVAWKRHVMVSGVAGGMVNYSRKTDAILFYTKTGNYIFNTQHQTVEKESLEKKFNKIEKETQRRFETQPLILDGNEPRKLVFPTKTIELPKGKRFAWNQGTLNQKLKGNPYIIYWTRSGIPRQKKYLDEFEGFPCSNLWDDIFPITSNSKESLGFPTQKPEKLLDRILKTSSNEGDIVADFFCGSGTTLAVAEKLGRRWIGCDLSKYAIHVTRKRLLDIPGCRPFKILNLGFYQKHKLKENGVNGVREYRDFILRLYEASPISGYYIHGRKGRKLIHIGAPDSFVTEREIKGTLEECRSANSTGLDVLGWEFEMGLYELIEDLGDQYGVDVKLKQIPIDVLDMRKRELANLKFFDLNYLDLDVTVDGRRVTVEISRFVIANWEYLPEEIRESIEHFRSYIDYWAVDFDYKDDVFHNMRQEYRAGKKKNLGTRVSYEYKNPGEYDVLVKVVDIIGNDTNKIVHAEVK